MSKELTPLEALDKLVAYILLDDEYGLMDKQEVKNVKHDKKIIETTLKEKDAKIHDLCELLKEKDAKIKVLHNEAMRLSEKVNKLTFNKEVEVDE